MFFPILRGTQPQPLRFELWGAHVERVLTGVSKERRIPAAERTRPGNERLRMDHPIRRDAPANSGVHPCSASRGLRDGKEQAPFSTKP